MYIYIYIYIYIIISNTVTLSNVIQHRCKQILLANYMKYRTQLKVTRSLRIVKVFITFEYGTDGANSYSTWRQFYNKHQLFQPYALNKTCSELKNCIVLVQFIS